MKEEQEEQEAELENSSKCPLGSSPPRLGVS